MVFKNDTHSSFDPVQKDSNKESVLFDRLCKKMENEVDKSISDSNGRRFFLKTILASVGAIGASFASGYVDGQVCFPESQMSSEGVCQDQIPACSDETCDAEVPPCALAPCNDILPLPCGPLIYPEPCDNYLLGCVPDEIAMAFH